MKILTNIQIVTILAVLLLSSSCSKYDRLLKSTDYAAKYEAAMKFYNKGDYFRSSQLLSDLVTVYRGTEKAEKVYYYYAYSHFGQEDYLLASYHFKNYVKTFPFGQHVEECAFMAAKCYYLDSPVYSLDQTNTVNAIEELQLFINTYPNSPRIKECNEMLDQLRYKLAKKSFENAKLYYDMEYYESAIVALGNTIKDFPESKFVEEAQFLIFKSHFYLAKYSIESKKNERLKNTVEAFNVFMQKYPTSDYKKEIENLYSILLKELEKRNIKI